MFQFLPVVNLRKTIQTTLYRMHYRLELLVEPWATDYYKTEANRSNDNAGYDLYCEGIKVSGAERKCVFLNQGVRARMVRVLSADPSTGHASTHYTHGLEVEEEVHYRLVPRSSICKTPLYMANSEGIIDRTYRGPIMAPVKVDDYSTSHLVEKGVRLFQIVAPDLGHIKEVVIVDSLPVTSRGEGGFGSTGR
jgi:dUTPase